MRYLNLGLAVFGVSIAVVAGAASDLRARDTLTPVQKREALAAIARTCADVWCQGDDAYDFNRLRCEPAKESCWVGFVLTREAYLPGHHAGRQLSCEVRGVRKFRDLVEESGSLNERFYVQLNDCISAL